MPSRQLQSQEMLLRNQLTVAIQLTVSVLRGSKVHMCVQWDTLRSGFNQGKFSGE
jgi:hypothetical protein